MPRILLICPLVNSVLQELRVISPFLFHSPDPPVKRQHPSPLTPQCIPYNCKWDRSQIDPEKNPTQTEECKCQPGKLEQAYR